MVSIKSATGTDQFGMERPYNIVIVPLKFDIKPRPDVLHLDLWVKEYEDLFPDDREEYKSFSQRLSDVINIIHDYRDTCKLGSNKMGYRNKFLPVFETQEQVNVIRNTMGTSFYDVFARPVVIYDIATFLNDAAHINGQQLPYMKPKARRLAKQFGIPYPRDTVLRARGNAEIYRRLLRSLI